MTVSHCRGHSKPADMDLCSIERERKKFNLVGDACKNAAGSQDCRLALSSLLFLKAQSFGKGFLNQAQGYHA
jgi:hypothetical protein